MIIPELMKCCCGEYVDTIEKWENIRRPEIISLFSEFVYGVRPVEKPVDISFETEEAECDCADICYKKIKINFCGYTMNIHGYYPGNIVGKVPAVVYVMHEYQEEKIEFEKPAENTFIDIKETIQRGYAVIVMPTSAVAPDFHNDTHNTEGVFKVFGNEKKANSWAIISAWAWGASRVMDYIETDNNIDKTNVAVAGHSRSGKAALWCAATDERFRCSYSNNSGCTGAAMTRTKSGERVKDIVFTEWFCENYSKYIDAENMLPVDQHMLIASIAPRNVYVTSSVEDEWSSPEAERLSCRMAGEVYELYGKKGVEMPRDRIEIRKAYHDGSIGYHVKEGDHSITHFDWNMFLDFLDKKSGE